MAKLLLISTLVLLTFSLVLSALNNAEKTSKRDAMGGDNDQDVMSQEDVASIMTTCNESFRIEMSYLEALNQSGSFPDEMDRTPKCYVRCVLEKTGVSSEDGVYDPATTVRVAMLMGDGRLTDTIQEIATTCSENRDESCKCERAYAFMKCVLEKVIEKSEKD